MRKVNMQQKKTNRRILVHFFGRTEHYVGGQDELDTLCLCLCLKFPCELKFVLLDKGGSYGKATGLQKKIFRLRLREDQAFEVKRVRMHVCIKNAQQSPASIINQTPRKKRRGTASTHNESEQHDALEHRRVEHCKQATGYRQPHVTRAFADTRSNLYATSTKPACMRVCMYLQEGEHHATTDHELVALVQQRLNHSDLGRDLGATDDGSEGTLGLVNGTRKVVKLLLDCLPFKSASL